MVPFMSAKSVPRQQLRFDVNAYKKRVEDAVEAGGGVMKFAETIKIEYQLVQGWAKGSIPRQKDWSKIEVSGKGMAWYLFGIDDMPEQKAIDRQALAAIVEKLREQMDALEEVCADLVPPKKERRRRGSDRPPIPLRAVKKQ